MNIINGRELAATILKDIKIRGEILKNHTNVIPKLDIIQIGNNEASNIYVKNKINIAKKCNFIAELIKLPKDISQKELVSIVDQRNKAIDTHGIIVQLPLPKHIDPRIIAEYISEAKDVDCLNTANIGYLWIKGDGIAPCTPLGIIKILENIFQTKKLNLSGLQAVIIGRSNLVGKPIAAMLLQRNATITIAHSYTKHLQEICKQADILISAAGYPHLVTKEFIKPGAIVIDVGINRIYNKTGKKTLVGDVDFENCKTIAGYITPVPGGVGPLTIALLMYNLLFTAERLAKAYP